MKKYLLIIPLFVLTAQAAEKTTIKVTIPCAQQIDVVKKDGVKLY